MTTPRIMPGAEPFAFEGGSTGVLCVHGYTGTPQGLREWGEDLAGRGYTVLGPRLPGHGTSNQDLHGVGWQDFAGEAERALRGLLERCSSVFVAGLSLGGTIVLDLAARFGDDLAGLVAVNPFLYTKDPRAKLAPLLGKVSLLLKGVYDDIAEPGRHELGYPKVSTRSSASVLEYGRMVRSRLPQIRIPALVFVSNQDHVVDPSCAQVVHDSIGSAERELIRLERSYHVATLDYDRHLIFERSAAFVAAHAKE